MKIYIMCVAMALASAASSLSAATLSMEALDNATVQPGGPRSGGSGKNFFNIQGSGGGNFASYGVADFNLGAQAPAIAGINSAKIQFVQTNAFFTADGPLLFSLDTRAGLADIQPGGTSPLAFDGADPGTTTDEGQGDLDLEAFSGTFNFVEVANGNLDEFTLGLSSALETELVNRLNAGDTIRIVIGSGNADVAATWAGFSNSTDAGPTLVLDVAQVPEPASIGLLLASLLGMIALYRRK